MKRYFFVPVVALAILFSGCNKSSKTNENTVTATETAVQKDTASQNVVESQQQMNDAAAILAKPEVPVLCYHRISEGNKGDYTVSPAVFESHMKILADSGYSSILPAQLYDYLVYNKPLPAKPVLITFDDSRTEHIGIAAPVMEKYGFKGAFFIMTITYNKKNYMTTDEIAKLAATGHSVGLHSWDHTMVTKYKEDADWQKQVVEPKAKLEKIIGGPVEYWAYPNGVFNHEGAAGLSKHFKISFILNSKRDSVYPLQTVRRIIVPEWKPEGLLNSMNRTYSKK